MKAGFPLDQLLVLLLVFARPGLLLAPDHAPTGAMKPERRSELRKRKVEPGGFATYVPECAGSAGDSPGAGVLDALKLELPVVEEIELLGHHDDVVRAAGIGLPAPAMEPPDGRTIWAVQLCADVPCNIELNPDDTGRRVKGAGRVDEHTYLQRPRVRLRGDSKKQRGSQNRKSFTHDAFLSIVREFPVPFHHPAISRLRTEPLTAEPLRWVATRWLAVESELSSYSPPLSTINFVFAADRSSAKTVLALTPGSAIFPSAWRNRLHIGRPTAAP